MIPHKELAILCKQSYLYESYTIRECELLLMKRAGVQVVIIRGTEGRSADDLLRKKGWLDVWRDAKLFPWYDKNFGWGHYGFIKGGISIASFLSNKLDRRMPIVLTGHSMGAALSLVVMADLIAKGFNIKERVGFAEPKSQLSKRTWAVKQTIYRHRADIVPLMPRWSPYRHNIKITQLLDDTGLRPTWSDHPIELYIKSL